MREIIKYAFKFKGLFSLRLLFTILKSAVNVVFAIILGSIVDVFIGGKVELFFQTIALCISFIILEVIVFLLDGIISSKYSEKTINNMRSDIFNNIMKKDISTFTTNNTGKYISILNNDISIIKTDFIDNLFELFFNVLCFITTLIVMISISVEITATILIMGALSFITTSIVSAKIIVKKGEYSNSLETLTKTTKDLFSGFEIIKNFNILNKIKNIFNKDSHTVEKKRRECLILVNCINTLSLVWVTLTFLAVLLICGYGIYKGTLTAGTVIIVTQLIDSVTGPIGEIVSLSSSISSVKEIANKIKGILIKDEINSETIKKSNFDEEILLSGLSFSYNNQKIILDDINLKFEKGKKYAVVGASGSGKSTLIKLLMRYYTDYKGKILIDGNNIQDIDSDSFYKVFSVIQQNVFMFDETIKENLCLFNEVPEEKLNNVITKCGIDKVFNGLEAGIYSTVGEGGEKLSGGERQRIAIGRALLRETKIMILDEFTSALDNETANEIEASLLDIPDITLIAITHKLSMAVLSKYDEIIVMRDGKIVEQGSFEQLISYKEYFYSLYHIQGNDSKVLELAV